MSDLKEIRKRINTIKATSKITRAMQMIAVAKLRRARDQVDKIKPYVEKIENLLETLLQNIGETSQDPLIKGGGGNKHLFILVSSERGLCGGFNTGIFKKLVADVEKLQAQKQEVQIICVGKKGYDLAKRKYKQNIVEYISTSQYRNINLDIAENVSTKIIQRIKNNQNHSCTLYYSKFKSILTQIPTKQHHVPMKLQEENHQQENHQHNICEFEPEEELLLAKLLPHAMKFRIFKALLENYVSELSARMTAMDSATRNAGELVDNLTLKYNRTRQSIITTELIEIISGAEALKA